MKEITHKSRIEREKENIYNNLNDFMNKQLNVSSNNLSFSNLPQEKNTKKKREATLKEVN